MGGVEKEEDWSSWELLPTGANSLQMLSQWGSASQPEARVSHKCEFQAENFLQVRASQQKTPGNSVKTKFEKKMSANPFYFKYQAAIEANGLQSWSKS